MEQLQCAVHSYAWGKLGRASLVAQLMEASDQGFRAHEDTAYAELWMGTHPNGPAKIVRGGVSAELLSEWLKDHPEAAGKVSTEGELPFLFKVLSVGKALSIQAHPDIELAQALHKKAPNVYKDPNHKPEMAIALTRFEALCQFRPIDEIVGHIANISELQAIADRDVARSLMQNRDQSSLQTYFQSYINADEDTIRAQITSIHKRLSEKHPTELSDVDRLVLRLIDQYGHDIGCLCPYLLNYITLEPGEAVFLGASEPHAYLFGDCIECMACSDNVVRAGLTPKFIDKETLSEMLTYRTSRPTILSGDRLNDNVRVYTPPVPEFEIEAINIRPSCSLPTKARSAASILVVISGTGTAYHGSNSMELCPGRTLLIGAGEIIEIEASKVSESPLVAYRAFPNESGSEREDEANFNVKGAKGSSERP